MKNLTIGFDERLELLSVLFYLSSYKDELPYIVNLDEDESHSLYKKTLRFFENTDVSELNDTIFKLMEEAGFGFDAPINLFLSLTPDLRSYAPECPAICDRLNGHPLAARLLDLAIKFHRESGFQEFYSSNRAFYESIRLDTASLDTEKIFSFMDVLYDRSVDGKDYAIKLMSGTTAGNYGITLGNTCCCVSGLAQGKPYLYPTLILHEFSHPIINPLTAVLLSQEEKHDKPLFSDIMEQMKSNAYDHNEAIINEYMIRAVECLFVSQTTPGDLEKYMQYEIDRGFIDIAFLVDRLTAYTNGKSQAFADFYRELLADFVAFLRGKKAK